MNTELLNEIVDYAGLFPPAGLSMEEAATNYSRYLDSNNAWMLGRFVLPSGRLNEFVSHADNNTNNETWRLSVLLPAPQANSDAFEVAMEQVHRFSKTHTKYKIDSLECRLDDINGAELVRHCVSSELKMFWELGLDEMMTDKMDWILHQKNDSFAAKIRTGGVEPQMIPSVEKVAAFVVECCERDLAFKATAGLHHPLCGNYPLTYAEQAPCGLMFGYLNVFVGAMLAKAHGWSRNQLCTVLSSADSSQFTITEQHVGWGKWLVGAERIAEFRRSLIVSFGSCSFREPVDEFAAMGFPNKKTI